MTTNRFSVIVSLGIVAALALTTISMIASPRNSVASSPSSNLAFRQGEWNAGASAEQAYLDQRYGEQTAGHVVDAAGSYDQIELARAQSHAAAAAEQAYEDFRHGEQTTGVNSTLAYLTYRRGEWSGK